MSEIDPYTALVDAVAERLAAKLGRARASIDADELVAVRSTGFAKALRRAHAAGEIALYRPAKGLMVKRGDLARWIESTRVDTQNRRQVATEGLDPIARGLLAGKLRRVSVTRGSPSTNDPTKSSMKSESFGLAMTRGEQ